MKEIDEEEVDDDDEEEVEGEEDEGEEDVSLEGQGNDTTVQRINMAAKEYEIVQVLYKSCTYTKTTKTLKY